MRVLGIESSCDETAAAVVEDGERVLSDVVYSQVALHRPYGGVVPELASRAHVRQIVPVIERALADAGATLEGPRAVNAIAVTRGPGLVGALLVGVQAAKAIAWARGIPLVGVHHLEGHLSAIFLYDRDESTPPSGAPPFPHLALLVSGGHTALVVCEAPGNYRTLGATRDDAAGEAFDKVAKMLGLGYPGGATIDRLARAGNPRAVAFPKSMRGRGLDFSFSGLKTAVAATLAREARVVDASAISDGRPGPSGAIATLDPIRLADLSASFQHAVCEQLLRKTLAALDATRLGHLQISGGVAANSGLRSTFAEALAQRSPPVRLYVPPIRRCTDNAAMIAAAGYHHLLRGERADLTLNATASLALDAPVAAT